MVSACMLKFSSDGRYVYTPDGRPFDPSLLYGWTGRKASSTDNEVEEACGKMLLGKSIPGLPNSSSSHAKLNILLNSL